MIERDYIMRMISQLAAVLAKIFFAKNAQNYAEALRLAQSACEELLGLNGELIDQMEAPTLALLLGDKEKIKVLATLLREEGDILQLQEKAPEGNLKYEKALALYQEALRMFTTGDQECEAAIKALHAKLNSHASKP
jgi:predicted RNA polymerase sigma factor